MDQFVTRAERIRNLRAATLEPSSTTSRDEPDLVDFEDTWIGDDQDDELDEFVEEYNDPDTFEYPVYFPDGSALGIDPVIDFDADD